MKRLPSKKIPVVIVALLLSILFLFPLVWMLFTSFKTLGESMSSSSVLPDTWTLKNYKEIFTQASDAPIILWLFNTGIVTLIGTTLVVIVDVLAAYALARLKVPGKKLS